MVGVQYKGKKELFRAAVKVNIKKLHRRESNPGRKRERLECYQLHHNGLLKIRKKEVQQDERDRTRVQQVAVR